MIGVIVTIIEAQQGPPSFVITSAGFVITSLKGSCFRISMSTAMVLADQSFAQSSHAKRVQKLSENKHEMIDKLIGITF